MDQNYLEQKYIFQKQNRGTAVNSNSRSIYREDGNSQNGGQGIRRSETRPISTSHQRRCYMCSKSGCWSSHHLLDERRVSFSRFQQQTFFQGEPVTPEYYQAFLAEWEGVEGFMTPQTEVDQFLKDWDNDFSQPYHSNENFFTDFGPVNAYRVIQHLNN